jgi:hypothetical protein
LLKIEGLWENNMPRITVDMIHAVKVVFVKPIFEDDFVDKGMIAWLTDIEWEEKEKCYKLYFDFEDFETINKKYFKAVYYSNIYTKELEVHTGRKLFTAFETNNYHPKYSVYFSLSIDARDDALFEKEIQNYLMVEYN